MTRALVQTIFFCQSHLTYQSILYISEGIDLIITLTKWSNTLKQFVGNLPTNRLSVFDHFLILAFKGLTPVILFISSTLCYYRTFQLIIRTLFYRFFIELSFE